MKGSLTSGGGGGGSQGGTRVAHIAPQPHPLIDYVTQWYCLRIKGGAVVAPAGAGAAVCKGAPGSRILRHSRICIH